MNADRYDKRHLFDVEISGGVGQYREPDAYMVGCLINVSEIGNETV